MTTKKYDFLGEAKKIGSEKDVAWMMQPVPKSAIALIDKWNLIGYCKELGLEHHIEKSRAAVSHVFHSAKERRRDGGPARSAVIPEGELSDISWRLFQAIEMLVEETIQDAVSVINASFCAKKYERPEEYLVYEAHGEMGITNRASKPPMDGRYKPQIFIDGMLRDVKVEPLRHIRGVKARFLTPFPEGIVKIGKTYSVREGHKKVGEVKFFELHLREPDLS